MTNPRYPTRERLREILHYDPRTGIFTWLVATARATKVGSVAGSLCGQGYVKIQIDGVTCQAHLLAWLYVYGVLPKQLDHRDLDEANNRIRNLRRSTTSQNQANTRKRAGTSSVFKGVTWNAKSRSWQASIKKNGKNRYLGLFDIEAAAGAAYATAAEQMFGKFARLS
jgi:HNH endonuclease